MSERGSVVVMMAAAIVVAGMLAIATGDLGGAAVRKARADTAADAAALAAADALARGRPPGQALAAARAAAADDGAVLITCRCAGANAEVVVRFADAHATARAEVAP
jgi:Putative Flp pilus-assembly TadE/G-like